MKRNSDNMGSGSRGRGADDNPAAKTAAAEPEAPKAAGDGNGGGGRVELKKGPWTMTEDMILMEYVKENGEGNWNAIRKKTGLMRCGKSCRLRWANHLRPNLKKGAFSPQEERMIIELHAKLGNKWARMASQLPGRTDNEIKNFWNTRMKRRQKSNLPLYPDDVQEKTTAYCSQRARIEQQQHFYSTCVSLQAPFASTDGRNFLTDETQNPLAPSPTNRSMSYPAPPSNTLQPCQPLPLSSLLYPPQTYHQSLPFPNNNNNNSSNGNLTNMPPFMSMAPPPILYHYEKMPSHIDSAMPEVNLVPNPLTPGPVELDGDGLNTSMSLAMAASSSSTSSGGDCMMRAASSCCSDNYEMVGAPAMMQGNSGLLDVVLEEAKTILAGSSHHKEKDMSEKRHYVDQGEEGPGKGKSPTDVSMKVDNVHGNQVLRDGNHEFGQWDQLSSTGQSSLELSKAVEDPLQEMDDDLSSLLRDFPSTTMPEPDWYRRSRGSYSDGPSPGLSNGLPGLDVTGDTPPPMSPAASAAVSWENMPGVC